MSNVLAPDWKVQSEYVVYPAGLDIGSRLCRFPPNLETSSIEDILTIRFTVDVTPSTEGSNQQFTVHYH